MNRQGKIKVMTLPLLTRIIHKNAFITRIGRKSMALKNMLNNWRHWMTKVARTLGR
jgi:hypothetical protein